MNPFEEPASPEPTREAVPGAQGLVVLRIVTLVWMVMNSLFFMVAPTVVGSFGSSIFETFSKISSGMWLIFSGATIALLIPFERGRRNTPVAGLALATLVLAILNMVVDIIQALPDFGGPAVLRYSFDSFAGEAFYALQYGLFVAGEVCFWLAITRSLERPSPGRSTAFFILLACTAAIALSRLLFSREAYLDLFSGALSTPFAFFRLALSVARELLVIITLRELASGVATRGVSAEAAVGPSPSRDFAIGGAWLGAGLLVTIGSYASAAEGGGRYVITSGAIIYGLVRIIRGLVRS